MLLFSHGYLDSYCINLFCFYSWQFIDPSEHSNTDIKVQELLNRASTALNNVFNSKIWKTEN